MRHLVKTFRVGPLLVLVTRYDDDLLHQGVRHHDDKAWSLNVGCLQVSLCMLG